MSAVEMIDRDAEKTLDLRAVQVHGQDAVAAGGFQAIRTDTSADADSRLVLFVPLGIAEERDDGGHLRDTGALEGVDPEQ